MKLNPNWFIFSDTHFGHHGLLKFNVRPTGYEEIIIRNWNKVISNKDYILMLGDLSLTNKEKTLEYCRRLNGIKYMLIGNHDKKSDSWYKDCGFNVVEPILKTFYDDKGNQMRIFFTHEPVIPLPNSVEKDGKEYHYFNIHGHLHGNKHHDVPLTDHHFDVSAECLNLTPIRLSEILALFKAKNILTLMLQNI